MVVQFSWQCFNLVVAQKKLSHGCMQPSYLTVVNDSYGKRQEEKQAKETKKKDMMVVS